VCIKKYRTDLSGLVNLRKKSGRWEKGKTIGEKEVRERKGGRRRDKKKSGEKGPVPLQRKKEEKKGSAIGDRRTKSGKKSEEMHGGPECLRERKGRPLLEGVMTD